MVSGLLLDMKIILFFVLYAVPAMSAPVPSSLLCFAPQDSCSWGGRGRTPTIAAQFWFESSVTEHV